MAKHELVTTATCGECGKIVEATELKRVSFWKKWICARCMKKHVAEGAGIVKP